MTAVGDRGYNRMRIHLRRSVYENRGQVLGRTYRTWLRRPVKPVSNKMMPDQQSQVKPRQWR